MYYRRAKDFSAADRRATHGRRIPPLLKLTMPHAARRQHDPQCRPAAHPGKPVGLVGPDRLGVDQVVWYGAAIMALCWPATPSEVKFAADSLLEEAGFEPSVPRDTTNSRPPHVASADTPPTRKSRRE